MSIFPRDAAHRGNMNQTKGSTVVKGIAKCKKNRLRILQGDSYVQLLKLVPEINPTYLVFQGKRQSKKEIMPDSLSQLNQM